MTMDTMDFVRCSRALTRATKRRGMIAPSFRAPPRHPDTDRSVLRRRDGSWLVAINLKGRDRSDCILDLIEGVIRVNTPEHLQTPDRIDAFRRELIAQLQEIPH